MLGWCAAMLGRCTAMSGKILTAGEVVHCTGAWRTQLVLCVRAPAFGCLRSCVCVRVCVPVLIVRTARSARTQLLHSVNHAHDDWVCALAVLESSGMLASGGRDGRIKIWRLPDLEPHATLEGHAGAVNGLLAVNGLSGPETSLISCSSDRTIRVWKTK